MIIKTADGWRRWQHGVVNLDGHAISDGNEHYPIAVYASKHPMVETKKYGSYMHLATAAEILEDRRRHWEKMVVKISNGKTKRYSDGRLHVTLYDNDFVV